jgi:hypothetical protein
LCLEGNGAEGGAPQFNCLGHVIDVGAISPAGQNLAKSLPGGRYGQRPSRSLGLIVLSPLDHPLDRRPLPPAPQANGEEASIEEGASSHEYSSERATHASSIVRRRLAGWRGGRKEEERKRNFYHKGAGAQFKIRSDVDEAKLSSTGNK